MRKKYLSPFVLLLFGAAFLSGINSCHNLKKVEKSVKADTTGLENKVSSDANEGNKQLTLKTESAREDYEYFKKDYQRTYNYIYMPDIHTIQLYRKGWEMTQPFIRMNTDERLVLSFDDLSGEIKDYRYTLLHCDADWQASDLMKNEYLTGFTEGYIRDYQFSRNTIQEYVHYDLIFPTEEMKITKSGNYLLQVYERTPENMAFVFRFMVFESLVDVTAEVVAPSTVLDRKYKQKVDFVIKSDNYRITNPYHDLKIIITQNGRWDNAIADIKPRMVKNNTLYYDQVGENIFNGGNEFRAFDIKSLKYALQNVFRIDYINNANHVFLKPDEIRTFKNYTYIEDIKGRRVIKTDDYEYDNLESDYVYVHFSLPYNAPFPDGNLYIMGELTYWQFMDEGLMKYNYDKKAYQASMFLKQGYYNYQYVFLEDGKTAGDVSIIEGNHFDTENEYKIFVYHREIGTRYDKLIAVRTVYSHE